MTKDRAESLVLDLFSGVIRKCFIQIHNVQMYVESGRASAFAVDQNLPQK